MGSELGVVEGEIGGLNVQIGKVETDADYLKGRQLAHESQDMSAQQEWLKYVRHHLGD